MFRIKVTGNFDEDKLESIRRDEMAQYSKALKSLSGIESVLTGHMTKMLIKKGFSMPEIEQALQPFIDGYDFEFNLIKDGVEMIWDGHYWIDYLDEHDRIIAVMHKAYSMLKPWFWIPNAIKSKLGAIRDPTKFFLPKVDEPSVREKHTHALIEEVEKRFRKLDPECKVSSEFKGEHDETEKVLYEALPKV